MDKRFQVTLSLDIKLEDGAELRPFFVNTSVYSDLPYDGVITVQQLMLGVLNSLGDAGVAKALDAGLGEKLSALGLGDKVAALQVK